MRISIVVAVCIYLFPMGNDAHADSVCERIVKAESDKSSFSHLANYCLNSFNEKYMMLVQIEEGYLPIPEHYYLKVTDGPGVELSSARFPKMSSLIELDKWPFGRIRITKREFKAKIVSFEKKYEIEIPYYQDFLNKCELPISLTKYVIPFESKNAITGIYDLEIGNTFILVATNDQNLPLVFGEIYMKLNCGK